MTTCSCHALGIHYKFVVLSAPPPPADAAVLFVRRITQQDQAVAFARLRSAHRHSRPARRD